MTDTTELQSAGIDRAALAALICDVCSEMVHVHGFFQCDPHPGNLLARKNDEGREFCLCV